MVEIYLRLKQAMTIRDITQADLVKLTGLRASSISDYVNGKYEPKQKAIYLLAKALGVSPAWLMGVDVPMEPQPDNMVPIKTQKVPLIGTIAAGIPITTNQEFEYIQFNGEKKIDFCLRVKGDSMVNARINDGDLVFCRKQETVENGEIAAVIIDDTATLKRFYYINGIIQLVPENPKYPPLVYTESDYKQVRVLGKAIAFQSLI